MTKTMTANELDPYFRQFNFPEFRDDPRVPDEVCGPHGDLDEHVRRSLAWQEWNRRGKPRTRRPLSKREEVVFTSLPDSLPRKTREQMAREAISALRVEGMLFFDRHQNYLESFRD